MRTQILATLAIAAFAATAATGAEDGGEVREPVICDEVAFAPPLTTDGFAAAITAPDAINGSGQTDLFFTVDLGPDAYEDTMGRLDGTLTWTVVANDYDLSVNSAASDNYQPFDPAEEFASSTVRHCQLVVVTAIDFLAPLPVEDLDLELDLTRTN